LKKTFFAVFASGSLEHSTHTLIARSVMQMSFNAGSEKGHSFEPVFVCNNCHTVRCYLLLMPQYAWVILLLEKHDT